MPGQSFTRGTRTPPPSTTTRCAWLLGMNQKPVDGIAWNLSQVELQFAQHPSFEYSLPIGELYGTTWHKCGLLRRVVQPPAWAAT